MDLAGSSSRKPCERAGAGAFFVSLRALALAVLGFLVWRAISTAPSVDGVIARTPDGSVLDALPPLALRTHAHAALPMLSLLLTLAVCTVAAAAIRRGIVANPAHRVDARNQMFTLRTLYMSWRGYGSATLLGGGK